MIPLIFRLRLNLIVAGTLLLGACGDAEPDRAEAAPEAAELEYLSSEAFLAFDLPFSQAVRVGDVLYVSGQIGTVPGSIDLAPGGIEAEARQTLENIRAILESAGSSMERVIRCLVMLDDMAEWPAFNQVYLEFFRDPERRPARSAFGADGLALGARVEVECTATAPPRR